MRIMDVSRRGAFPRARWKAPNRSAAGNALANTRWFRNRRSRVPTQIARIPGQEWTPFHMVYVEKAQRTLALGQRIGIAKGKFEVPPSTDVSNDEVIRLLSGEEPA